MKTSNLIRKSLREIQRIHEQLGEEYLLLCDSSQVEPFPVIWSTYPPCPDGETQAHIVLDIEGDTGAQGIDVWAETRAELPHVVFIHVLGRRLAASN